MKKGDIVKVYGSVDAGESWGSYIPYCRGCIADVVGITSDDEILVKFKKSYSLLSEVIAVAHPMQCRKVKSGKTKKSNKS